jgi:hypothetical protein
LFLHENLTPDSEHLTQTLACKKTSDVLSVSKLVGRLEFVLPCKSLPLGSQATPHSHPSRSHLRTPALLSCCTTHPCLPLCHSHTPPVPMLSLFRHHYPRRQPLLHSTHFTPLTPSIPSTHSTPLTPVYHPNAPRSRLRQNMTRMNPTLPRRWQLHVFTPCLSRRTVVPRSIGVSVATTSMIRRRVVFWPWAGENTRIRKHRRWNNRRHSTLVRRFSP